ncbi:hypothetical protein BN946_scf184403.g13 [Trametes cinnabarina]|uniref:RNA helicase n=1 Tax=Pycnoporus cinnabarinus TaxID=5643 RepID=A0A060SWY5_PYCCI|nr:hypothetical protein BN946_scf184403.g13 [Trametes cinnabarina]
MPLTVERGYAGIQRPVLHGGRRDDEQVAPTRAIQERASWLRALLDTAHLERSQTASIRADLCDLVSYSRTTQGLRMMRQSGYPRYPEYANVAQPPNAEGDQNPFTKRPYGPTYKKILEDHEKLPVFAKMDEFFRMFNDRQVIVMVGETGPGKATQTPQFPPRVAAMSVAKRVADGLDAQIRSKAHRHVRYIGRGEVPLFKVPGRTFPVEILYTQEPQPDYAAAAIRTVLMIHRAEEPGDILLFLTGEEETEDACRKLTGQAEEFINEAQDEVGPLLCIPLYSSLPPQQQQRISEPPPPPRQPGGPPRRKVVVSTNIPETSLTIEGIVYVVDPGLSKQEVYNPRIRIKALQVTPISKASA